MFKDPSSPVKASNFNTLNPDLLTLYRRPSPIKIWPTYAVPPTTPLYPRSTYDLWRAGSSPTIFQPVEKFIPLTTTSQSGPDQPRCILDQHALSTIKARSLPIRPFFQSGSWSGLWCERALTNRLRNWLLFLYCKARSKIYLIRTTWINVYRY